MDQHRDRDAQFRHINATVTRELAQGRPVISVDTKKDMASINVFPSTFHGE